jgi:hypothetical protein
MCRPYYILCPRCRRNVVGSGKVSCAAYSRRRSVSAMTEGERRWHEAEWAEGGADRVSSDPGQLCVECVRRAEEQERVWGVGR